nr:glycosyltransferase family 4 protein [Thauera sedimentorum]
MLRLVSPDQTECVGAIGVDLDHFAPASSVVEPLVFILAARLLVEKGVREYVEAARLVRRLRPEVRFILLGSPDQNPGSVSHSELLEWSSEGVVEWQAHVDDVRPWLARASVYVLPTWYREGVPRGIQEAMAMGRPVITTDMPGCRDAVVDGETGLLVPPRDSRALADCMLRFVDAPGLVCRMGQAARKFAEQAFDVHAANDRILRAMR